LGTLCLSKEGGKRVGVGLRLGRYGGCGRRVGIVESGREGEKLLNSELLRLVLVLVLDATLEDVVLLNFLVEHHGDLVDLR
jgi:hypothetical protein